MDNDASAGSESYKVGVRRVVPPEKVALTEPTSSAVVPAPPGSKTYDLHTPIESNPALDSTPPAIRDIASGISLKPQARLSWHRLAGISLIALGLIAGSFLILHSISQNKKISLDTSPSDLSSRVKPQTTELPALGQELSGTTASSSQAVNALTVNGQVNVTDSLVLQPSAKPSSPAVGQLYYNESLNQVQYYNGTTFVSLQGGGNTNTVNNTYESTVINNVTNGGGVSAVNGKTGDLAVFTSSDTLGNSLISENGTTLTVGSAANSVSIGSTTATDITTLQGGTGGISIQTGNSSATVPGSVTIDTGNGVVSGTLIEDLTFENNLEGMTGYTGGGTSCALSTAEAHSGSYSLAMTGTDQPGCRGADFTPVPGHKYYIVGWSRAATTPQETWLGLYWGGDNGGIDGAEVEDSTTGWTEISGLFTAPAGATNGTVQFFDNEGASSTHYFDDITVTDLSTFSGYDVSLGATNAKAITIGNSNEIGFTNILGGGGISLGAGVSDVDVTGAGIGLVGTSDSEFVTTGTLSLQGGAASDASNGGVTINTSSVNGASGSISIQSGDSATTASGNVSVDTGANFVSGTVVYDADFEDGTDNINAWTGIGTTATQNCSIAYTGSCSLDVSGPVFWGVLQNNNNSFVPVTAGHHYAVSVWVRASATPEQIEGSLIWNIGNFDSSYLLLPTTTDTTTGWTQISVTGIAPAGATEGEFRFGGNDASTGGDQYFDDLTVTDLSSGSASSELDLGNTNAQIVNIGNMNETEATTIDGGSGINVNAGVSNLELTGGDISVEGSGASSLETTSGSLTLGAGGGTGGGVLVRLQSDSTTALNVQSAEGTSLFDVDSTDNEISLGTGAGSALGYTSAGPFDGGGTRGNISAQKETTTAAGTISSVSAYIGTEASPNNLYQIAIYADNGSGTAPGAYIASTAVSTLSSSLIAWYTLPITASLAANTTYWIVYWQNWPGSGGTDNSFTYSSGGGGSFEVSGTSTWQSGADNGLPVTFPTVTQSDSYVASLYASYTSAGPALTVNQYGALTLNGPALFQDPTNSTVALQVQDSLGNPLLTVDTADEIVDIKTLTVTSNLTVGGHIITGGNTPTVAAGAAGACGSTATTSITGDDTTGTITVTTGTGSCSSNGIMTTVSFATPYGDPPNVTLTPANAGASTLEYFNNSSTDNAFTVNTNTNPAASTIYKWHYIVAQ
jgi:hypothetical protein